MENKLQNTAAEIDAIEFQKTENQVVVSFMEPGNLLAKPTDTEAALNNFTIAGLGVWPDLWYFPAYTN